jgi:hypothetical protein
MSQQEMRFESNQQEEPKTYNNGYEAYPHYNNDYGSLPFNQKITGEGEQISAESAHLREHRLNLRIGMAITSLTFWMIFFFAGIAIILSHPTIYGIEPLFIVGLGVFTVLVILANILINRKRI